MAIDAISAPFPDLQCKTCTKCGEEKQLNQFSKAPTGAFGVRGDCKKCRNSYTTKWIAENPDLVNASARARYAANPLEINVKTTARRDRGKTNASNKKWRAANPEKARKIALEHYHRVIANDPKQRLDRAISSSVYASIKRGSKNGKSTFDLLGYSLEQLVARLEPLFQHGMSWENYGEWHVDHVFPKASFGYSTPECEGFKKAWALSNLQPLWADDNHHKNARLDHPSQAAVLAAT
ncbi:hypothetical protein A4U53_030855 [Rhizobium ruizarguesonis]|uniref:Uncharacterized protein n=2 Tax=Rhizobium TaxID=379 RepID=A0A179BTY6_RHILE|nr:hypothetical protein [Rhizobium leguminosarum]OAP95107.1 hypothetical protein A4U53_17950 [Rhizobium leguminosarum]